MNRLLPVLIVVAAYSISALANQESESNQTMNLYCAGKDWASTRSKHILVSIDKKNQIVSITDALREAPRVLQLVETPTMYKAHGDHLVGYVDVNNEKTLITNDEGRYCKPDIPCKAYISYAVDFQLNRQNGTFEYIVAEEVREEGSNLLLKELNGWGIFKDTRCKEVKQKF